MAGSEARLAGAAREPPPSIVIGTSRLPKNLRGDEGVVLIVELALDAQSGRILDVATTVPLPGYGALLRSVLVQRTLEDVEGAAEQLALRLHGPLLRPTIAALASAVANSRNGDAPGDG